MKLTTVTVEWVSPTAIHFLQLVLACGTTTEITEVVHHRETLAVGRFPLRAA